MKQDIEITATLSKTESVRRDNITANVRTEGDAVTAIEAGNLTDDDGNPLASFSQWTGSGLNINFLTPDANEIGILTQIKSFINDVRI